MKIGIYGYGNLGKGVELAAGKNPDTEIVGVFTRRAPETVKTLTGIPVYRADDVLKFKEQIDVMIICGGSATDLPEMTPCLASNFNVVDSFDTHANIPVHFDRVNAAALGTDHTALISAGWDPGMFSLNRLYASAILPEGNTYTFWGRGVSQGHSDAIRRIPGVKDARQYTVPINATLDEVREGLGKEYTARQMHLRECYVVAEEGADKDAIRDSIVTMPNYFDAYDTTVTFITEEEMKRDHAELPHGGFVIRSGKTGLNNEHQHTIEYSLKLDSNPEFTASALVCFARAIHRMAKRGQYGCKTVFDVAPADLSILSGEELRHQML